MSVQVAGVYRNGRVEIEDDIDVPDETRLLVTLMPDEDVTHTFAKAADQVDRALPRPRLSIEELAALQGVQPCRRLEDLRGDFWPEGESIDDFIAAVREWRRGGRDGIDSE